MDGGDLAETGVTAGLSGQVRTLARLARECGLDGIVCSAVDLANLRESIGAGFLRVTPGIRFVGDPDDQRRVATPGAAIRAGADYLVIGRAVTRTPDPIAAIELVGGNIAACGV